MQNWIDSADALKRSQLKYTRFANGFFMDYWGMPDVRTDLSPLTWAIDLLNCKAAIPGDGEDVLSFTYSVDLARFLVRMLDHDEWPEFSVVVGEDMTFNQLLRLAEKIRGRVLKNICLRRHPGLNLSRQAHNSMFTTRVRT